MRMVLQELIREIKTHTHKSVLVDQSLHAFLMCAVHCVPDILSSFSVPTLCTSGMVKLGTIPGDPIALAHKDLHARRGEYLFPLPRPILQTLLPLLQDPRDEPCLILVANIILTSLPAAAALFLFGCHQHWIGLIYVLANYALYMQRFMLTLHFSEHRRLFKAGETLVVAGRRCMPGSPASIRNLSCVTCQCYTTYASVVDRSNVQDSQ